MKKIKINCRYAIETRSYYYEIIEKKTKAIIMKGYYKAIDYLHKTTGDIANEIYNNNIEFLNKLGYSL